MKKLVVLLLMFSFAVKAQETSRLKGRVLDETKQPLPGANIIIKSLSAGAVSDFNGYYQLANIPVGTYEIHVSFVGYNDFVQKIALTEKSIVLNFDLTLKTNQLEEVVIKGSITKGQAKALSLQKSKSNITNVISSDQVGKFPDSNIGDALKRVPGISMQNDQGEARDIVVRGLAPQLNSVTLNGDRIPSAEGDNRRVQMDLIPSDMIQTIEVNKALTPDMEADAIGGSVNLITRSAPSVFRASINGAYGINHIRNKPIYNFSGIVANRFFDNKLGVVLNASYNSNDYGSDNVEFEWAKKDDGDEALYIKEHDIRRYDVKRDRKSISFNIDYQINDNHTIYLKTLYNQRDDWENRYKLRFKQKYKGNNEFSKSVERETKGGIAGNTNYNARLEQQKVSKISLGGEHVFFNSVEFDWKVGTSKASEQRANERYIKFKQKDVQFSEDFSNIRFPKMISQSNDYNTPSLFDFDEATEEDRDTDEKKIDGRFDILIPFNTVSKYKNSLKFGVKFKSKDKQRDNIFYSYNDFVENDLGIDTMDTTAPVDYTLNNHLAGNDYASGYFASKEFLGGINFQNGQLELAEFVPVNYKAKEDVLAGYLMFEQSFGDKLSIITGVRLEKTSIDYTGFSIDVETASTIDDVENTTGNKTYDNVLPNLQFKYNFSKNSVLRLAWTNAIARPNYYDLVPYENIDSKELEASFGNPDLHATKSMNFDIMAEHYFSSVGILSAGIFYKDVSNFIYNFTENRELAVSGNTAETYQVTTPLNGGTAQIYGFEFALQRKLNFLPLFFRNVTVYGNYTYTDSKTNGIKDREDGLPLAGAVKNMVNGSLAYETKKVSARISLNYAGDYIFEYDKDAFNDTYYDEQLFLDINFSYALSKKLRIFSEIKNLTNQELRFYQGDKNRTKQAEFYNVNWNAGLKYNF